MVKRTLDGSKPLASHLITYDHLNPSPQFTKAQIDFIESIQADFVGEDLTAIRAFEWFQLNLNWEKIGQTPALGYGAIPGLRDRPDVGTIYVRRYSDEKYTDMMDSFLDYVPQGFPPDRVNSCSMPGYRIAIPNGDPYYPCVFRRDTERWRKRLKEAADLHHTLLGEFTHGKFVLSNGQKFSFSSLKLDRLKSASFPEDW